MASCAKVTDTLKITQKVKVRFQLKSGASQTPHTTHCPLNCVVIGENCCGGLYGKEENIVPMFSEEHFGCNGSS